MASARVRAHNQRKGPGGVKKVPRSTMLKDWILLGMWFKGFRWRRCQYGFRYHLNRWGGREMTRIMLKS